ANAKRLGARPQSLRAGALSHAESSPRRHRRTRLPVQCGEQRSSRACSAARPRRRTRLPDARRGAVVSLESTYARWPPPGKVEAGEGTSRPASGPANVHGCDTESEGVDVARRSLYVRTGQGHVDGAALDAHEREWWIPLSKIMAATMAGEVSAAIRAGRLG